MKNLLILIFGLLAFSGWSQDRPIRVDLISVDTLTTAERNLIPADAGKAQYIFNITTNQLEERKPGGSWTAFSGSADGLGPDGNTGAITVGGSGTTTTLNDDVVTSAKILNDAITADDIGTAQVTSTEIAADAVGTSELNDGESSPSEGDIVTVAAGASTFEYTDPSTVGTDDQDASEVPITDAGGNYTSTNVEDALDEVLSKDDDAVEIATSGSRTNYTPASQNVESELAAIDAELVPPYRNENISSSGASSVNIGCANGRVEFSSSATNVDFEFTGESLCHGEPITLHLISTNASGTVFDFGAFVEDNEGNANFTVTLAQNEERTLHFVIMNSNLTRCTNYPIGSGGGTDDQNLSLSGTNNQTLNIEDGTSANLATITWTRAQMGADIIGTNEIEDGTVDETDLDTSVNASLDLADSAIQSDTGEVSGSSAVDNVLTKAFDRDEASPSAGVLLVQTDVPVVETLTGTTHKFHEVPFYVDNTTADNNLTFTDMDAWLEGIVDVNQATEPTFTASGYTVEAWTDTNAFEANTALRYIFQVQPSGSTIKFYRLKL